MLSRIGHSVGNKGANIKGDILVVQQLLNQHKASLKADGVCGPKTISSIVNFQKSFMTSPDGLVEPGGATLHHLIAPVPTSHTKPAHGANGSPQPTAVHFVGLPKEGAGYYRYSPSGNQFGTTATIDSVQNIAKAFSKDSGVDMGVGDISFADGRAMPPHVSHRRGTNVDIRPIRKDKTHTHTAITDDGYSRELTKKLVAAILADPNVRRVLFNDKDIAGVHFHAGHDNHLHVEMKK